MKNTRIMMSQPMGELGGLGFRSPCAIWVIYVVSLPMGERSTCTGSGIGVAARLLPR